MKQWENSLLLRRTLYEYDDASSRTRMRIQPSGGGSNEYDVLYEYDEASRMVTATDQITSKTTEFSYHDIGVLESMEYPNGTTASFALDSLNRLDVLNYRYSNDALMCKFDYGYDKKSNVTSLQRDDTGAGGSNKQYSFTYDDLSRLWTANYGDESVTYSYDTSGNRTSLSSSVDGVTSYTIDS